MYSVSIIFLAIKKKKFFFLISQEKKEKKIKYSRYIHTLTTDTSVILCNIKTYLCII